MYSPYECKKNIFNISKPQKNISLTDNKEVSNVSFLNIKWCVFFCVSQCLKNTQRMYNLRAQILHRAYPVFHVLKFNCRAIYKHKERKGEKKNCTLKTDRDFKSSVRRRHTTHHPNKTPEKKKNIYP